MLAFRTIRSKLLLAFFSFLFIGGMITVANLWFDVQKNYLNEIVATLTKIDRKELAISLLEKDFFSIDANDIIFYKTGHSEYLKKRTLLFTDIQEELTHLQKLPYIDYFEVDTEIDQLKTLFKSYDAVFYQLINLVKQRGFKDFGTEGKMRDYIHRIEGTMIIKDKTKLLTVRRHEKDYIIRKDANYLRLHSLAVKELEQQIKAMPPTPERYLLLTHLLNYSEAFHKLVRLEVKIGYDNNKGVKQDLNTLAHDIETKIELINDQILRRSADLSNRIQMALALIIFTGVSLNIALAIYATQVLSKPIRSLSDSIHLIISQNFAENQTIFHIKSQDEIGQLSKDVALMVLKVWESFAEIRLQSQAIENKQEMLMDSLRYASRIQEAILPDSEDITYEHFIIYKPLQLVSGDFYWYYRQADYQFVSLVDCTGHGVPGAFMSIIGHTLLNKIVAQDDIYDPAQILEILNIEIRSALKQEGKKNDDGMDLSICRIDKQADEIFRITFSGAKSAIIYTQHQEVVLLKGTNRHIGGRQKEEVKPFENVVFEVRVGDMLYLFSDGYSDQSNDQGDKFGKKRLKEVIIGLWKLPVQEQQLRLEQIFDTFKDSEPQRDDVSLLGIRLL
jgi:serine phosphatase RsbU (regulator of sigma subunit)